MQNSVNNHLSLSLLLADAYLPFGESLLEHANHCDHCLFCSEYRDLVDSANDILECSPRHYLSDRAVQVVREGEDSSLQLLDEDMYLYLKSKDCSDTAIAEFFNIKLNKLQDFKMAHFSDEDEHGVRISSFKEFEDDYIAIFQKLKLPRFLIQKSEYLVV